MEGAGTTAGRAALGAAFTPWKPLAGTLRSRATINGRSASNVQEESLLLPAVIRSKAAKAGARLPGDKH